MDPVLLVVLLLGGLAVVFAVQAMIAKRRASAEDKVRKGYFLLGLSGLMAKIAMADGRVTGDEAGLADRFFHEMRLSDAERAMCIGNFIRARRDGLTARDHAKRFMAYANSAACEFLYDLLWRLSRADGKVDPAEDGLLKDIASFLGLGQPVYENFKAGRKYAQGKAVLRAAGVPPALVALAD